jgi:RNA polymerase sigma-70 factor
MTIEPQLTFSSLAAEAYSRAYIAHGDLELQQQEFENYLVLAVEKQSRLEVSTTRRVSILQTLHTTDLYLTAACAKPTEAAWRCFVTAYRKYINDIARLVSPRGSAGSELAANVLSNLFLADGSGKSRIASFNGRETLATWLRVIISRRAINQGLLKRNTFENVDGRVDIADNTSIGRIEAAIQGDRYENILEDCLSLASDSLTDRERLMLLLRYEEGLRVVEVASALGIHPSGVTRKLHHTHLKLKTKIVAVLASKYHFGSEATKECLVDMVENPAHSFLKLLKTPWLRT